MARHTETALCTSWEDSPGGKRREGKAQKRRQGGVKMGKIESRAGASVLWACQHCQKERERDGREKEKESERVGEKQRNRDKDRESNRQT